MRPLVHIHRLSLSASLTAYSSNSSNRTLLRKIQLRPMSEQGRMEETVPEPERKEAIGSGSGSTSEREVKKAKRQFDFNMYKKRHIALKIAYLGWDYSGLAIQDTVENTIEARLFESLQKTKLIEDPHTCNYSRCGRTDKGVSALGQVVALHLRSSLLEGHGVITTTGNKAHERKGDKTTEIPYMHILNSVLPEEIRILAWAPVGMDFSARFSCLHRTYKYFFPLGAMDISAMRQAAQKFVGEHDFRNFCKMDISGGVTNFRRTVLSIEINPLSNRVLLIHGFDVSSGTTSLGSQDLYRTLILRSSPSPYQMYEMTVTGQAYLLHQIRCMAAIIFLVGNGLETPDIVDHMLDIEKCPRKPQYGMASALPLILYDCVFENVEWQRDEHAYEAVLKHFQHMWTAHMVKTTMIRRMLDSLTLSLHPSPPPHSQMAPIIQSDHRLGIRTYKPLLSRPTSNTFEERYEHHQASKRRKLQETSDGQPT